MTIEIGASDLGATVRYAEAPRSIGDAWITLDAALEERSLRATSVYRQTVEAAGGDVLAAPVVRRDG